MSVKKLDRYNRPIICDAVMKHAFSDKLMALALRRQNLAYQAYQKHVDASVASDLSAPWVTRDKTDFKLVAGSDVYGFDITGECVTDIPRNFSHTMNFADWLSDTPDVPEKIVLPAGKADFSINSAGLFKVEYFDLEQEMVNLCETMMQRKAEINAMLITTSSVPKLLKSWPEIEPFIPETARPVDVPATRELNAVLGLPV